MKCLIALAWLFGVACAQRIVKVRYGYFPQARPTHAACARGYFDLPSNNPDRPSYQVVCYPQTSGDFAAARLDNQQLDIANLGSSPWASAVARGLDIKVVFFSAFLGESQGLYVRQGDPARNYTGVENPYDLQGRTVGVPFGSTMHYQVLFLIDLLGIKNVNLIDLSPTKIVEEWDKGSIDGAGCWGAARDHIQAEGGTQLPAKTLASAGLLSEWGRPTFLVTAASRRFVEEHRDFMVHFVSVMARINDSFLDRLGLSDASNAERWDIQASGSYQYVASMVDAMMKPEFARGFPGDLAKERQALDDFIQLSSSKQSACEYLSPSSGCTSIPYQATLQTASFLLEQKVLAGLGRLHPSQCQESDTNTCGVDLFDGQFLPQLPDGVNDTVLRNLEASNQIYALTELGRVGGHSTCTSTTQYLREAVSGLFGDGADAIQGKSYSEDLNCRWELRAVDCADSNQLCEKFVELNPRKLRLWSGDFVRVYTDTALDCGPNSPSRVLLAQLTGMYTDDKPPPMLRAKGCMAVELETDSNQERTYGDDIGDGFVASYNRNSAGCSSDADCNGKLCNRGMCECGGLAWGGDCSETTSCLGTNLIELDGHELVTIGSGGGDLSIAGENGVLEPEKSYQNDLDCIFEIVVPDGYGFEFVKVSVKYDLESSFDLLWLKSGAESDRSGTEIYAVLSGSTKELELYYVPVVNNMATIQVTTDGRGRRGGFSARVQAVKSDLVTCQPGQYGAQCEFPHCVAQNNLLPATLSSGPYSLGRVVSQISSEPVPAMPWAAQGGCNWKLLDGSLQVDAVALRLVFNSDFDLEPQKSNSVEERHIDKLVINNAGGNLATFFVEECTNNEVCSYPWQTGVCENGRCLVQASVEVTLNSSETFLSASLVTDRNDGGQFHSGLDFDVLLVERCPEDDPDIHCEEAGGECVDGFCFCDGIACSCSCEGEAASNAAAKIGLAVGIVVPIFLLFIAYFLYYRRRKIRASREHKRIIEEKEAELQEFKKSVVGMWIAESTYVPSPPSISVTEKRPEQPKSQPQTHFVWCWKETEGYMSNHDDSAVFGNPADCWVKYDEDATESLEAAFQEQGGVGEFSPLPGYTVDFASMSQTKDASGFVRDILRVRGDGSLEDEDDDVSLSNVDIVDSEDQPEEIVGEPQMIIVEGDIIQISKRRDDGWGYGTKLHHADEAVARKLLSSTVDGTDIENFFTDTGWFPLELTRTPTTDDLAVLQKNVGDTGELAPPETWTPVKDPSLVELHTLPASSDERKQVESSFLSSFGGKCKIVRIDRVQNLSMWQSYIVKRNTICYRENQSDGPNRSKEKAISRFERCWLWHGTNAEVMDKIIQQGFNRSFCGKNATVYGKGVYFARDTSYSKYPTYAIPDNHGRQYILGCRVCVGEYCEGKTDALTPDVRDASKNVLFDSTVGLLHGDSKSNPSIFVTYHDSQAYPEYLIVFKSQ